MLALAMAPKPAAASELLPSLAVPLLLLGIFVVVAWVLVTAIRRRLHSPVDQQTSTFTLAELTRLHEDGLLTEEEFERAKTKMLSTATEGLHASRGNKAAPTNATNEAQSPDSTAPHA